MELWLSKCTWSLMTTIAAWILFQIRYSLKTWHTAGVIFEVKAQTKGRTWKQWCPDTLFRVHKVVLYFCVKGSTLALFCEGCEDSTPTSILGANASVFCQMVYYVYGETLQQVNKGIVQNIVLMLQIYIRARSKILQIKAEAWYVTHLDITVGNVSDRWVYVDKEDYCLLQETGVNLILEHGQEVLALDSVKSIP